jgi:hypothetical protein
MNLPVTATQRELEARNLWLTGAGPSSSGRRAPRDRRKKKLAARPVYKAGCGKPPPVLPCCQPSQRVSARFGFFPPGSSPPPPPAK